MERRALLGSLASASAVSLGPLVRGVDAQEIDVTNGSGINETNETNGSGQSNADPDVIDGEDDRIDLFVIGGQSNAEGRGDLNESPILEDDVAYELTESGLVPLEDPVGGATSGSAWPMFARTYHEATGRTSAYVEVAQGGSAQHPDADGEFGHWGEAGMLRDNLVEVTRIARTWLSNRGHDVTFRGILWSQGERDAQEIGNEITKTDYRGALEAMVDDFRASIDGEWDFYCFQTGRMRDEDTDGFEAVRTAQREFADETEGCRLVSDIQVRFPEQDLMRDNLHYNQRGYNQMGAEGAQSIATDI